MENGNVRRKSRRRIERKVHREKNKNVKVLPLCEGDDFQDKESSFSSGSFNDKGFDSYTTSSTRILSRTRPLPFLDQDGAPPAVDTQVMIQDVKDNQQLDALSDEEEVLRPSKCPNAAAPCNKVVVQGFIKPRPIDPKPRKNITSTNLRHAKPKLHCDDLKNCSQVKKQMPIPSPRTSKLAAVEVPHSSLKKIYATEGPSSGYLPQADNLACDSMAEVTEAIPLNRSASLSKMKDLEVEMSHNNITNLRKSSSLRNLIPSNDSLAQLTMEIARKRSYLFGSKGIGCAHLGNSQLKRYFPSSKITIFIATWNMMGMEVLPELDDLLLPEKCESVPDMYVIGTQESHPHRREFDVKIQETLGPNHVLVQSSSHGVLYLSVFLRRDLIWHCSIFEEGSVTTRPGPYMLKTKGAIAINFCFFGTSFLFVNCHLSPHQNASKSRIADFHKIRLGLKLPRKLRPSNILGAHDVTEKFDNVFWLGDINTRTYLNREEVLQQLEEKNFDRLMKNDELIFIKEKGLAFDKFHEGEIHFRPSYKFDRGTDNYDSSKKNRTPSYTDRILFKSTKGEEINCVYYDCAATVKMSDHKPVFGVFEVKLRPGNDSVILSGGKFDHQIWLDGLQRRAQHMKPDGCGVESNVCRIQ